MALDDIREIQVWLNNRYGDRSEWVPLLEDGIPGWGTVRGITRGVQIASGLARA
ncbi:hypothetical protein [Sediminivirga luteola]|uniref:hypothetical protein n=1 Tax=Sediminivirga luteola TaxID=1774748 RepID=UPI001F5868DB|nr:hypothetical protein [Sediminivirga luteola]MCI2266120.1 hypothetical protein [Sediminivirga luteola]